MYYFNFKCIFKSVFAKSFHHNNVRIRIYSNVWKKTWQPFDADSFLKMSWLLQNYHPLNILSLSFSLLYLDQVSRSQVHAIVVYVKWWNCFKHGNGNIEARNSQNCGTVIHYHALGHIVSNDKWIVCVIQCLLFNYTQKKYFFSLNYINTCHMVKIFFFDSNWFGKAKTLISRNRNFEQIFVLKSIKLLEHECNEKIAIFFCMRNSI